jgi:hypothetical protein
MADVTHNELVGDIARDVVTQLAPQELPIFRAVSDAYFANPESALKNLKSEDGVLGFGLDPTAFLFTPVVLHVVSELVQFLLPIAKKAVQDRVGSEVAELSKRLFKRFGRSTPPLLTQEDLTSLHRKVVQAAKNLHLSDERAAALANAVVVQCLVADY